MSTSSNNNLLFIIVVTLTEGKRHDAGMLRMSGLLDQLQQFSHSPAGQPLRIYGDPAYPLRIHLQAPYKAAHLTQDQEAFNSSRANSSLDLLSFFLQNDSLVFSSTSTFHLCISSEYFTVRRGDLLNLPKFYCASSVCWRAPTGKW